MKHARPVRCAALAQMKLNTSFPRVVCGSACLAKFRKGFENLRTIELGFSFAESGDLANLGQRARQFPA